MSILDMSNEIPEERNGENEGGIFYNLKYDFKQGDKRNYNHMLGFVTPPGQLLRQQKFDGSDSVSPQKYQYQAQNNVNTKTIDFFDYTPNNENKVNGEFTSSAMNVNLLEINDYSKSNQNPQQLKIKQTGREGPGLQSPLTPSLIGLEFRNQLSNNANLGSGMKQNSGNNERIAESGLFS